jgi:chaperonin GroES
MSGRNSLGGGDQLARGRRSVTFKAGDAKKGDKIQINKGTLMSDEDRKALDKLTPAPVVVEKKVMKRRPRPLYDRVVVRGKSAEETSESGLIIIPKGENEERPREGVVVFVGHGKVDLQGNLRPLVVKEGDQVLFGQYAGTEVSIDGEVVLMMREEEILAILE